MQLELSNACNTYPPGPWDEEPDYAEWQDQETGLPCIARRNSMGAWCGHVGIENTHPLFGVAYDDTNLDVHGGVTYAGDMGQPPYWWFGFDCGHHTDVLPFFLKRGIDFPNYTYKTFTFVKAQCALLAGQLA